MSNIQYGVLIHFGDGLMDAYHTSIVQEMYPLLEMFHEDKTPDEIIESHWKEISEPGWACDEDTFWLSVALWKALIQLVNLDGPIQPLKRILPAIIAAWNRLKGGVDVFSRLLKNVKSEHEHQKFHATFILRCQFTELLNIHGLARGFVLVDEINQGKNFKTYKDLKKFLNKMCSSHRFMEKYYKAVKRITRTNQGVRRQREDDEEEVGPYIQRSKKSYNKASSIPSPNPNSNVRGHRETFGASQKRCIMCCEHCSRGRDVHYRQGHRTRYGCVSCEVTFQKEVARKENPMAVKRINFNTVDGVLPLCHRVRFESAGDNRSCFEIYHQEGIQGIPHKCPYDRRFDQQDNEETDNV